MRDFKNSLGLIFCSLLLVATAFADVDFVGAENQLKKSADQIFNIFYQSCDAANRPPFRTFVDGELRGYFLEKHPFNGGQVPRISDLREAQDSQYYVSCGPNRDKVEKGCKDHCGAPPSYIWAGKGVYNRNGASFTLDLFSNHSAIQGIAKHPGLDCSGYVAAVIANAGFKIEPTQDYRWAAMNRGASFFMTPSTCMKTVKGTPQSFVKPGDVIAWKGHVVMVDSLGADPFGLNAIESIEGCSNENLKPSKFSLVVSNAVGSIKDAPMENLAEMDLGKLTGVGIGLSKWQLGQFIYKRPVEVMELAKVACFAKFGKKLAYKNTSIVRHVLNGLQANAEPHPCKALPEERIKVEGAECLEPCKN